MMVRTLLKTILMYIRRLLGTDQIIQIQYQLKVNEERRQKATLALGNALRYSGMKADEMKATLAYKRCADILSLLSPRKPEGQTYARIGRNYDGGYVMLDNFRQGQSVEAAYSFGICDDVSWDEAIADCGIDVFMYDHTIQALPKDHPKFHFYKTGITGHTKGSNIKTLAEILADNGHEAANNLLLKMDIEGCEWDVFDAAPSGIINRFSQIVIELHGLTSAVYGAEEKVITAVLNKINETHQVVHVHANGYGIPVWLGDLVLPDYLEVTYVRRNDFTFTADSRTFPTEFDQPTLVGYPDVYLGRIPSNAEH